MSRDGDDKCPPKETPKQKESVEHGEPIKESGVTLSNTQTRMQGPLQNPTQPPAQKEPAQTEKEPPRKK